MDKSEEISEEDLKRLKEAAEESLGRPWMDTAVLNRVPVFPDELLALVTEIERLRAERDRLEALLKYATNFDAGEKTIIVQINWKQKNVWIVERDEVEGKRTGWLCEGGQWISWGNGGSAHDAEKFPTREAAFSAYEAARAKEAAE